MQNVSGALHSGRKLLVGYQLLVTDYDWSIVDREEVEIEWSGFCL